MSREESDRAELALQVIEKFPKHYEIYDSAMAVFGKYDEGSCFPEPMKNRLAEATLRAGVWGYGWPGLTRLAVAQQLGPRDPKIIEDVARAAFHSAPLDHQGSTDIRPHARAVLASFGAAAAPWREPALKLMNSEDSLGTGAAQVAAASRDPAAVSAVAGLLSQGLKAGPGKVIKRERAQRLVELGYALGAAGETAQPWVGSLIELLNRDVESLAPPFGVIERPPNEICRALNRIGGIPAQQALQSERCKRPWFLLPS
jgi:hypothetical protein